MHRRLRRPRDLSHAALFLSFLCGTVSSAPGELDQSFGNHGRLPTLVIGRFGSEARSILTQEDDRLVFAGRRGFGGVPDEGDFLVMRLMPDGSFDASFGSNGVVAVDFAGGVDIGYAVIQQPDGKFVIAGAAGTGNGAGFDIGLARLNPDGSPDTTFGIAGRATLDLGGSNDIARGLLQQADGKLVIAGSTDASGGDRMFLARLRTDGSLDTTFGVGGTVVLDFGGGAQTRANALARQPDGKFVIAGTYAVATSGAGDFAAARVTAEGVLDDSFGGGGWVVADLGGDGDAANSIAVQAAGKLLLAGLTSPVLAGAPRAAILRLETSGRVDSGFGTSGSTVLDATDELSVATSVLAESDGGFVVTGILGTNLSATEFCNCGSTGGPADMFIGRFRADGRLDTSYGTDGIIRVDFGTDNRYMTSSGSALVRQRDGQYVVAGTNVSAANVAIARISGTARFAGLVGLVETDRRVDEAVGVVSYQVRRTGGATGAITADYRTVSGQASAGADFIEASGTLSWADGDATNRTVNATVIDDDAIERPEDFTLVLSNAIGGAEFAATVSSTTIVSSDGPGELSFFGALDPITVDEQNKTIPLFVNRKNGSKGAISVRYSTRSGTASAGSDFEATSGTLTWADGDTTGRAFSVRILDDQVNEPEEAFSIGLSAPTGGAVIPMFGSSQLIRIRASDGTGTGGGGGAGGGGGSGGSGSGGGGGRADGMCLLLLALLGVLRFAFSRPARLPRRTSGAARTLLMVADRNPDALLEVA